jgi:hypothetical protein
MAFPTLDGLSDVELVLAVAWRFLDDEADRWTARLSRFKDANPQAVRGACAVVPDAVAECRLPWRNVVLVGVIPSREWMLPAGSPVAQLGAALGSALRWDWQPELLAKEPHRPLDTIPGASERAAEVAGKYQASATLPSGTRAVIILDDLATCGVALTEVARALRVVPGENVPVWGLVVGKDERRTDAALQGFVIDNLHVPAEWGARWDAA